jgi:hypothetical protein
VSYAHTRYFLHTYIGTHVHRAIVHPSILSSIHYCCAAKHSVQVLMSRHGTCHLSLLQMDATVAKCRTQHLISPKNGTRRCVCCRRVGKKYDTYRADATAMPGPATRTTGQIRAAHLQGRIPKDVPERNPCTSYLVASTISISRSLVPTYLSRPSGIPIPEVWAEKVDNKCS